MTVKRYLVMLVVLLSSATFIESYIPSWNQADPMPLFSTMYPYWFFSLRQKENLREFEYTYPLDRFNFSITPFFEQANRGRDWAQNNVYLGDLPHGRWNMLGLFWDPPLRNKLFRELSIQTTFNNCVDYSGTDESDNCTPQISDNTNCVCEVALSDNPCGCFQNIASPRKRDLNREFGYFSIPLRYLKGGVRFEGSVLLIDRCFYSIEVILRTGIANVQQNVVAFNDLSCQALGTACPAYCSTVAVEYQTTGQPPWAPPLPQPVGYNQGVVAAPGAYPGVTPPYVQTTSIPPCSTANCPGMNAANPLVPKNCLPLPQQFTPIPNMTCSFGFGCDCKKLVIEKIMKQKQIIGEILGRNFCDYDHTGLEDLRIELLYRHLFIMNDENIAFPRYIFMPFVTIGAILPLDKPVPNNMPFAVPIGSNGHFGLGGSAGFTLDFLSTIDIGIQAGFTHFFERKYCNLPLPTQVAESGIYPYTADVMLEPGRTAYYKLTMHAYHFLDLLSTWIEYVGVIHNDDNIKVCRSFIPPDSCYFNQGFLTKEAECRSSWSSQLLRIGFNYDLSPNMLLGFAASIPLNQRNAYNTGTILASLSFVY